MTVRKLPPGCVKHTRVWEQEMLRRYDERGLDGMAYSLGLRVMTLVHQRVLGQLTPPCACLECKKKALRPIE